MGARKVTPLRLIRQIDRDSLPMYYFGFNIRKNDVGTRFLDIMSHTLKHFAGMRTAITDTGNAKNGNLPTIVLIDFGDSNLELIAHTRENGFDDLP